MGAGVTVGNVPVANNVEFLPLPRQRVLTGDERGTIVPVELASTVANAACVDVGVGTVNGLALDMEAASRWSMMMKMARIVLFSPPRVRNPISWVASLMCFKRLVEISRCALYLARVLKKSCSRSECSRYI